MSSLLRSFRDDLRQIAQRHGDRPAILDTRNEVTLSYEDLTQVLKRYGTLFQDRAVGRGTVMAILPNSVENLCAFLATASHGQGYAPLSTEVSPREVANWIALVRPALCLVDASLSQPVAEVIAQAGIPTLTIAMDAAFAWLPAAAAVPKAESGGRLYLTTSGSTGEPKALAFDSDRLWSSGHAFTAHHQFVDETARFFNILPMSYLGGLFNLGMIPLTTGGSVVIAESFSGRSFLDFWQNVERYEITVLWLVPTIVRGLLAISERTRRHEIAGRPRRVIASFLGTAPIDLATKARFEEVFGIPLLENFALSETTFFSTETLNTRPRRSEGSMGPLLPYADTRFAPVEADTPEGAPPPTEIRVKSPFLFLGYLQGDGSLDLPLDAEGYFRTGDLGHLADGQLVVDGRIRDIIKKGGYFVSLREIEILAEQDAAVAEAIAVKVPHDFYGESHVLYLRLTGDSPEAETLERFARWLHGNLVRYKWPERIVAVKDFPRTASGKVRKHLVAEAAS